MSLIIANISFENLVKCAERENQMSSFSLVLVYRMCVGGLATLSFIFSSSQTYWTDMSAGPSVRVFKGVCKGVCHEVVMQGCVSRGCYARVCVTRFLCKGCVPRCCYDGSISRGCYTRLCVM